MADQKTSHLHIKCKGNHPIQRICLQESCNAQTYSCESPQCYLCKNLHKNCKSINLQQIYHLIIKNQKSNLDYFNNFRQMQQEMIELIKHSQIKIKRNIAISGISSSNKRLLFNMFAKENLMGTSKEQIRQLMEQLSSKEIQLQRQKQYKNKQIDLFIAKSMQSLKTMLKTKQNWIQNVARVSSKIIQNSCDILYLHSLIYPRPRQFELLFRASDHQYQAKYFHQKCDGIANTLVIVQTQFQKVIAAFTPTKWFSGKSNYSNDQSKYSFISSVSSRRKLSLKQEKYAIFCDQNHGPCFGRGFDLKILNKCNQNSNNYIFCPYSYTEENIRQVDHTRLWSDFCGSVNGYKFKIMQYEVFRVIY